MPGYQAYAPKEIHIRMNGYVSIDKIVDTGRAEVFCEHPKGYDHWRLVRMGKEYILERLCYTAPCKEEFGLGSQIIELGRQSMHNALLAMHKYIPSTYRNKEVVDAEGANDLQKKISGAFKNNQE